jgi:hypothetical protein
MGDGTPSEPVQLEAYTDLAVPVGAVVKTNASEVRVNSSRLHPILQTVRIPLADLEGADLTQVRRVRFTFDGTDTGAIYMSDIRISPISGRGTPATPTSSPAQ